MNYAKSQGCIWIIEPTPESLQQEEEELPMKAFHGIRDAEGICHLYLSDGETLRKSAPTIAVPFMTIAQRFLSGDMADRDLASYRSLSLSKH